MEQPENVTQWLKESVVIKLSLITFLSLVLLIPSTWIQTLITERSQRQEEMMADVSNKWSGKQLLQGPVLVIPYKTTVPYQDGNKNIVNKQVIENLYILPENLHVRGNIGAETLHRGIFDAAVYTTQLKITGNFTPADLSKLNINADQLMPEQARLTFSITDLKGLKTNPVVKIGREELIAEPAFSDTRLFDKGLQVAPNLTGQLTTAIPFTLNLDVKGSQELRFLHLGKTTDVQLSSNWPTPSFDGRYLPDNRDVNIKGFDAHWRMLYYNRPFPQQWTQNDTLLNNLSKHEEALFGVKLKLPVDQYQKTMRTSKYAILIILLTFISLFLTELIRKQRVHLFNYVLIGAAMVVYYTLLLSFSEQFGYNLAYLIASAATIGLIAVFTASILKNGRAAGMFAAILALFYGFIFIIIQLEDLALMVGSVALFIIIAVLMYFSRKINWERN